MLRKAEEQGLVIPEQLPTDTPVNAKEQTLIGSLADFASTVKEAGETYSPACIANYVYDLVREFNQFYHDYTILGESDERIRQLRLTLSAETAKIVRSAMSLLGIEMPERM